MKSLGQIAFEAYSNYRGWKDVRGEGIPQWEELSDEVRAAWMVAAQAVMVEVRDGILEEAKSECD